MPATHAQGTLLKYGTYSIGLLESISGVQISRDTIEVTSLGDTDGFRKYIGGLADGGEVSFSGYFDPKDAGQAQLRTQIEAATGAVGSWSIVFPTALSASWAFDGILVAFNGDTKMGDKILFDGAIKVTGKPVLTA